jgi:hypothetical protein
MGAEDRAPLNPEKPPAKALLLAQDDKIKDPTILEQLR